MSFEVVHKDFSSPQGLLPGGHHRNSACPRTPQTACPDCSRRPQTCSGCPCQSKSCCWKQWLCTSSAADTPGSASAVSTKRERRLGAARFKKTRGGTLRFSQGEGLCQRKAPSLLFPGLTVLLVTGTHAFASSELQEFEEFLCRTQQCKSC